MTEPIWEGVMNGRYHASVIPVCGQVGDLIVRDRQQDKELLNIPVFIGSDGPRLIDTKIWFDIVERIALRFPIVRQKP